MEQKRQFNRDKTQAKASDTANTVMDIQGH